MRLLNILVIVALVSAAAYVYEIKFESTLQAERLAKLRGEIRRERDAIAVLRAEWAKLNNPERIQGLSQRHLALKPVEATQIGDFDRLPERSPQLVSPDAGDPIATVIEKANDTDVPTGNIGAVTGAR